MSTTYHVHKDFMKCLKRMTRKGGKLQKASDQARVIHSKITSGEPDPFRGIPKTKHGETRIKNCVKYDLRDFARLVTIVAGSTVILRYIGSHEDVDRWLDSKKGTDQTITQDKSLKEIKKSDNISDKTKRITIIHDNYAGKIIDRLDANDRIILFGDLPGRLTEQIRELRSDASEDKILAAVSPIDDEELKSLIFDVLVELASGDFESVKNRIRFSAPKSDSEKLTPIDIAEKEGTLQIKDGENVRAIKIGSKEYEEWVETFLQSENELDWFLFMHPEQEKFVNANYPGAATLSGVSGSGKTCIAIRRAVRLATSYLSETIAIVTLNRSLARMIASLVDHICPNKDTRDRIKVFSFFELCQMLLKEFEPENQKHYSDVTWVLEEHIDEVFREFYRCQAAYTKAEVLRPLHKTLTAREIDAENYIREEFDWIRSALSIDDRTDYLDISRSGRVYPLQRQSRELILDALESWEEKMRDVGVIDYLGLTTALSKYKGSLRPRFRSIIVDEVQDFGTTELEILRNLVDKAENDLFLCGDLAQHILPKHQNFSAAGINLSGRAFSIRRNYRNTREILRAAYEILVENLDEAMLRAGEMDILDPEYASRSSSLPVVLEANSLEDEIAFAIELMNDNAEVYQESHSGQSRHRGCIAICGYSLFELSVFSETLGLPVLDGSALRETGNGLVLSDLEQTKGYEFDTVAILNCTNKALPPLGSPNEEAFRYGCQLYVAMTRARDQLILSYAGEPSTWLNKPETIFVRDLWETFVDPEEIDRVGTPGFLPEVPDSERDNAAIMELDGTGFNYTFYARGLSGEIQDKLEELVSGRNLRLGKHRIEWKNVGLLYGDLRDAGLHGRTGHIFGPVADERVLENLERASRGLRPLARRRLSKPRGSVRKLSDRPARPKVTATPINKSGYGASIAKLDLDIETFEALREIGCRTVGDVLEKSPVELIRSANINRRRIQNIRSSLKEQGFDW